MTLNKADLDLILSALENDRIGKWGDERHQRLEKLIPKVKRERAKLLKEEAGEN